MTEILKTQPIKNISLMQEAVEGMISRNKILPGMAVVYAPSGYGKSVAGQYISKKYNAVYLQAGDSWSKKKLLNQILEQLNLPIKGETISAKTDRIVESLKTDSRPIIIDEFDYCITKKMLGIIREEVLFNNIKSNSIDAIITDPPYGLKWDHKIETHFNFQTFINNSYRVLKDNGFLVYFGQEPTISQWNTIAQEKFHYLAEIIWYKRGNSAPYHYPLRVHEKIMIFTKSKGKLNKATVDWEHEKEEIIDYTTKDTILRAMSEIKKLLKESNNIEELRVVANDTSYQITKDKSKVNDDIYKIPKYRIPRHAYLFNQKKLTTLWGCRPHNHQGYNKDEFNIKHPTVKPIQ